MPSLRKCFQDGVHLLCHGCQRKLELLLRKRRRKWGEGKIKFKLVSKCVACLKCHFRMIGNCHLRPLPPYLLNLP